MKKRKWLSTIIAFILVASLAISIGAGACGPPAGEVAEEVAELEAELAAEKQKVDAEKTKVSDLEDEVSDLEDEIAALKKPAKVYRWEPSVWIAAGLPWDFLVYMADYLNELSNGRIVMTPSAPGAVCPVEELMEATGAGTTQAMLPTPSYYAGKLPVAVFYNSSIGVRSPADQQVAYEVFEGGKAEEIYFGICEDTYNVKCVGTRYGPLDLIMSTTVPLRSPADLQGVKFRCGDEHASVPLTALGASTVWAPGTEIYTMLATGVVDGVTYGSAYDHYSMSFHEVTDYWTTNAKFMSVANEVFVVNMDIWNEMSDDLKYLVEVAIEAANNKTIPEGFIKEDETWKAVQDYGVEAVTWTDEDVNVLTAEQMKWAETYLDVPENAEWFGIIQRYATMKGYL
jgi:TRAP-type mannitol/chloroaromatic compound transport system substrate-binding protein